MNNNRSLLVDPLADLLIQYLKLYESGSGSKWTVGSGSKWTGSATLHNTHLGRQILQNSGQIDGGPRTHALSVIPLPQQPAEGILYLSMWVYKYHTYYVLNMFISQFQYSRPINKSRSSNSYPDFTCSGSYSSFNGCYIKKRVLMWYRTTTVFHIPIVELYLLVIQREKKYGCTRLRNILLIQ